jgi:cell division septation protein DedD
LGFCKRWELPKPQSQEIAKAPSPKPADTEEPGEIVMTEATPVTTKPLDDSSTMQVDGDPSSGVAKAITGASEPKTPNIEAKDMLQYSDFRSVLHKWHVRLHKVSLIDCINNYDINTRTIPKAFISCLESKDYIKMRNAIVVLDKISDYFPIIKQIGMHIEGKMAGILQAESREDLKLLLTRYDASLKRNSSKWIPIEQFHSVEKPHEAVAGKSETTGKPTMAQQATAKPPLPVDTKLPSNPKPPTETKLQATPASTSTTADQHKGDSSSLESNRILPARSASRQDLRRERKSM